jgi:hypothetical protein
LPSSPRRHLLVKNAAGRPMAGKGPRTSPGLPAEAASSYDAEAAETSPEAASPAAPGSRTRWSNSSAAARNSPGDQAPYGTVGIGGCSYAAAPTKFSTDVTPERTVEV